MSELQKNVALSLVLDTNNSHLHVALGGASRWPLPHPFNRRQWILCAIIVTFTLGVTRDQWWLELPGEHGCFEIAANCRK